MCKVAASLASALMATTVLASEGMSEGFVYLLDIDPTIITELRYVGHDNFIGRPIKGYEANRVICTKEAALRLKEAHTYFKSQGYTLVIYDAFRPQISVDEFRHWGKDLSDNIGKSNYYPTYEKAEIFAHGFVADIRSSHTRGSTFDLTLIKTGQHLKPMVYTHHRLKTGEEIPFLEDGTVDMGSSFDLFHPASMHDSPLVADEYTKMRNFLRKGMMDHGFDQYPEEWWHYTLHNEPYPDTYFSFPIK